MSAPIQLVRVSTRRASHRGLRMAARIAMGALCAAVFLTVFAAVYLNLPR